MAKFIEIGSSLINVESIRKVDFISDDIYLGLLPKDENGKAIVDFIPFVFANIELFTGEIVDLVIDLYSTEGEEDEAWAKRNRAYIQLGWQKLIESIGEITKVTGYEYGF